MLVLQRVQRIVWRKLFGTFIVFLLILRLMVVAIDYQMLHPEESGLHPGNIDYDNTLAVVMPETGDLGNDGSELCRFGKK
jgi:hypothetical protein